MRRIDYLPVMVAYLYKPMASRQSLLKVQHRPNVNQWLTLASGSVYSWIPFFTKMRNGAIKICMPH